MKILATNLQFSSEFHRTNMKKLLLIFMVVQMTTSQEPSLPEIDKSLNYITTNLLTAEQNLNEVLANYSAMAQSCSEKLKSLKIAESLSSALDELRNLTDQLKTIDEVDTYSNMTNCSDVNQKLLELDSEYNNYMDTRQKAASNQTQLSVKYSKVYAQYGSNINKLGGMYSTNERMVYGIIEKHRDAVLYYSNFIVLLGTSAANLQNCTSLLTDYQKSFCGCTQLKSQALSLTNDLKAMEEQLINVQSKLISVINTTLKVVQEIVNSVDSSMKTILQAFEKKLKNLLTTSEYRKNNDMSLTTCSDFWYYVNYMSLKQRHYSGILTAVLTNSSAVTISRKKIQSLKNLTNEVTKLEEVYRSYENQLRDSIDNITKGVGEFLKAEGTFCMCKSEVSTKATAQASSSTKKLTTTKITTVNKPTTTKKVTHKQTTKNPIKSTAKQQKATTTRKKSSRSSSSFSMSTLR